MCIDIPVFERAIINRLHTGHHRHKFYGYPWWLSFLILFLLFAFVFCLNSNLAITKEGSLWISLLSSEPYSNTTCFFYVFIRDVLFVIWDIFSLALSQVCDCQYQFARWEDGQQRAPPCFGSCQGPEFSRTLLEIERNFHRSLKSLHSLGEDILDVKSNTWCNQFNQWVYCSLTRLNSS